MDELRYWRRAAARPAAGYCDYLCALGDWARYYGSGEGDDLGDFIKWLLIYLCSHFIFLTRLVVLFTFLS